MSSILYICDWLPPDFGAVGQYALAACEELSRKGNDVYLIGLNSERSSTVQRKIGSGNLTSVGLRSSKYDKSFFLRRTLWTVLTNIKLSIVSLKYLNRVNEVVITGAPPLILHFIAPLCCLWRKRLTYRINDFHPECLIVATGHPPKLMMRILLNVTLFWRRRVDHFEIIGEDQRKRLKESGIPNDCMTLRRDGSPVKIDSTTRPLTIPATLKNHRILLYSGNMGVAHDWKTFADGYIRHHTLGSGSVCLWLNANGASAQKLEDFLRNATVPVHRTNQVPIDELASLLVTADAHLITLIDRFVGYVLPSKVYGCIDSGRPIIFIGSTESDIHLLCSDSLDPDNYFQIKVGQPNLVFDALEALGSPSSRIASEK